MPPRQMQRVYRADKKPTSRPANRTARSLPQAQTPGFSPDRRRVLPRLSVRLRILLQRPDSGQQYRVRPVREVIAEIESIDASRFFFVDDALGLNREAGKKLFTEMIPLSGIGWGKEPCRWPRIWSC